MENMTLLELGQERDRLINESLKLQEHIRKLKQQARELEIEISWAKNERAA